MSKVNGNRQGMSNIFRSKKLTSNCAWLYLRASWALTSGLKRASMLLTTTLGCQRRQKATPKRLLEVGLSLVQLTSLHVAAVAPVDSPSALAKLCGTMGPTNTPCCTTAEFRTLLARRQRECSVWHLSTLTSALSKTVTLAGAAEGATGTIASSYDACRHPVSGLTARQQQMYFSS